jgi:hypothetical protein
MSTSDLDVSSYLLEYNKRLLEAQETIRTAFAAAGIEFDEREAWHLKRLSHWINGADGSFRFQDPDSRKLIEKVSDRAHDLLEALGEAWAYSGFKDAIEGGAPLPNDEGSKVNVCETFFGEDPEAGCTELVWAICYAAQEALRHGLVKEGKRGRKPQLGYYQFIRELHDLYVGKTGEKGFSRQSEAEPKGPFVDLAVAAQAILPMGLRIRERSTIAWRILAAVDGDGEPAATDGEISESDGELVPQMG